MSTTVRRRRQAPPTNSIFPTSAGHELTSDQLELQQRARTFVETVLMPLELEAEERGGRLPEETVEQIKREAIAARLNGGRFALEHGGQGWSMLEWFLVNEQFGRVTNGLHWHVPSAYNVLLQGTPGADRALPRAGAARRGRRRLRGHRGRGGLGPGRDRDDRGVDRAAAGGSTARSGS